MKKLAIKLKKIEIMTHYSNSNMPEAYVGINKNRLKSYANGYKPSTVYLNDKQEFQLELFNPSGGTVLAKIKLNGDYISERGLVLKPGERVWLDRYIDENKKFLFSTYIVEDGNSQVDNAIRDNGLLEIEFYDEKIQNYINIGTTTGFAPYYNNTFTTDSVFGNTTFTSQIDPLVYGNFEDNCRSFCASSNDYDAKDFAPQEMKKSLKETGRVEKGNSSNQTFNEVNMEFNLWTFHTVKYKILPYSQKNEDSESVRVKYCTSCGKKITKTNWKFCPDCGEKI